jgi:hypothetical protein
MKLRRATIELRGPHEAEPVTIVGDAAIATVGVGDGRLVPVLIVATSGRPDIEDFFRAYRYIPTGDHTAQWAHLDGHEGKISLVLKFVRPSELTIILEFDIVRQGGLVDQIIRARALYLQPGRPGDRLSTTLDQHRVIVEIGDLEFRNWNELLSKHLIANFRASGLSRQRSKQAAKELIEEWRKATETRLRGHAPVGRTT